MKIKWMGIIFIVAAVLIVFLPGNTPKTKTQPKSAVLAKAARYNATSSTYFYPNADGSTQPGSGSQQQIDLSAKPTPDPKTIQDNMDKWFTHYRDNVSNIDEYVGQHITYGGIVSEIDRLMIEDQNHDFRSFKNATIVDVNGKEPTPGTTGTLMKDGNNYLIK